MWVNNEVGTIQPVAEIGRALPRRRRDVPHRRACRRSASCPCPSTLPMPPCSPSPATRSARRRASARSWCGAARPSRRIIHGGSQQFGLRPGTENVAGAVALGRAAELAAGEQAREGGAPRRAARRAGGPAPRGHPRLRSGSPRTGRRAPHVLSVAIPGADTEALLMHLDLQGVAASGGSACTTGAAEPSHVLTRHGRAARRSRSAPCASRWAARRTAADIDRVAEVFPARGRQGAASSPGCSGVR